MKKIVIIGAGIAGLTAGWYLKQRFGSTIDLSILEKSERVGGLIRTVHQEGFLFEEGPRGFRPMGKGKETLSLVKALGIESSLISANEKSKKRYLCLEGKLTSVSLKLLLKNGLVSALLKDWRAGPSSLEDESIACFCLRRFNASLLETFVDPLVRGIFGGDARTLSCRSCFPLLWELDQGNKSIFWNLLKKKTKAPSLYTFKEGMEMLPNALAKALSDHIKLSTPVLNMDSIEADAIFTSIHPPLFSYASIVTVNCGWHGELLRKRGYGFLVPSKEKESIWGMTFDSDIFPDLNQGVQTRVCVMLESEERARECALEGIQRYLGITKAPDTILIGHATGAIPQYTIGHSQRVEAFKRALPSHVHLLGNSYEGVGVNDCIKHARCVVESFSF